MRFHTPAFTGTALLLVTLSTTRVALAQRPSDPPPPPAAAPQSDAEPIDDEMREAEARRQAARAAALKAAGDGDPLDAFLALDRALELAPADAEVLAAKKGIEDAAVMGALKRAGRLSGEGDIRAAVRLLAQMRLATDDPRIDLAWKAARAERDALERAGKLPPEPIEPGAEDEPPATRDRPGATGVPPPLLEGRDAAGGSLDRDLFRTIEDRVRELERRLDRVSMPPSENARAESAVDFLERKMDEQRRDLERQINDLRREVQRLSREVDSARREAERLRSRP